MPMFFFNFHAAQCDPPADPTCGGAYVNCWIQDSTIESAEITARRGIEEQGWTVTDYEETPRQTSRENWDKEKLEYYDQALIDREVWLFHRYPLNDDDPEWPDDN
jgi:hypothetical protein